jgi:Lamin Tail Domain
MAHSKSLWRGLFFILLITTLCGGVALPAASGTARAAPMPANTLDVVINEIAWGGTVASASAEWIELYNTTTSDIDLTNWTIVTADGNPTIITIPSGIIPKDGYFLLERAETAVNDIAANYVYGGSNFSNSGESLQLLDSFNNLIDTANNNGGGWPAGTAGTGSPIYGSMERVNYLIADSDTNWLTNNGLVRNGSDSATPPNPINGTPKQINSATPATLASTATEAANLTSTIAPILTGTAAANLTATASVVNMTNTAVAANLTATASAAPSNTPTNTATATNTSPPITGSATHVVISEFRTRGPGGAEDEFVEIYNPTSNPIDISGWVMSASNDSGTVQNRATIPLATLLRSGQYYLIAHNGYVIPSGGLSPNLKYGTSISDSGGIALINATGVIIEEVGMSQNSFYQEGTPLSPLTTNSNKSYERKDGGASDSCFDTDDNSKDFQTAGSGTIHNYSSPLSLCGSARPAPSTTVTTILADSPDPSLVNGNVSVSVKVTGGSSTPLGLVSITGANTNCTINLNSSGTGSCTVKFTSTGTKALTATYLGDNTHASSTDGEAHLVSTTTTIRTPTARPSPLPPPPLIGINEFVPRPGHDWNNDGVINTGDEYIELLNHGVIDVNLSGYSLDDEVNIGSTPYRLPSITLKPGERHVFYGSETGLLLSDGGDGVRLLKPNGQLGDAYNYFVVRFPDQSYCRLPDNGGLDDWNQNCFPTPGLQNSLSGSSVNPPTENGAENLCPISDTLPDDFVLAECPPFGNNIWNPDYWDKFGWFDEKNLPESPGKWPVFAE